MTQAKRGFIVLAASLLLLGLGGAAYAFHSGGVAECIGCHSMHNPVATSFLLVGENASSTCLTCHQRDTDTGPGSYRVSTRELGAGLAPLQRNPGGDFGWLRKTFTWAGRGPTPEVEEGASHGHNIVAPAFGYVADTRPGHTQSPGGSFPSGDLACVSCHDPHGRYRRIAGDTIVRPGTSGTFDPIIASGSYNTSPAPAAGAAVGVYRLLGGSGYEKAPFPGVPAAVAPSSYNRSEASTQTRVAYGSVGSSGHATWGRWCGACHGDYHVDSGRHVHVVDQGLGSSVAAMYNAYVKTGDLTGTSASSFSSLVPFVSGPSVGYTALAALASSGGSVVLTGPAATDQISCLSCHRAHASAWEYALRWNPEYEFLTKNGAYCDPGTPADRFCARGHSLAETEAGYYDRPATVFATYQRSLCNKCHGKD